MRWPNKDPDEILDYSVDWSRFIGDSTIASVAWFSYDADGNKVSGMPSTTIDGLTFRGQSNTDTVASVELSNGTLNKTYKIICAITFGSGLVAERTIRLTIKEK